MGRRVFKIVAKPVWFPIRRLRRKFSRAQGNLSLQILEYSTPRPKFKTQIWISNSVGANIFRWHLGINSSWRQLGSSLELSLWNLGIHSVWSHLGYPLGFAISGDSFLEIPPCFPPLGFTLIIRFWGTTYLPVGIYYTSPFLGTYIRFYIYKKQKQLRKVFIYKMPDTFQKAGQFRSGFIYQKQDTLRYAVCHEVFELGICIQKAWHFALRDVFTYKNPDNSQKARQFALRFLYTKIWTLCVTRFFIGFFKLAKGGVFSK